MNNVEAFYKSKELFEKVKEGMKDRPLMYYQVGKEHILLELNSDLKGELNKEEEAYIYSLIGEKIDLMGDDIIEFVRERLVEAIVENKDKVLEDLDITIEKVNE